MTSARSIMRLYKDILRQHQYALPKKHRELGDRYVRSEFRAHKNATGEQAAQFVEGWESYLNQLRDQTGPVGRPLSEDVASHLNDEQREQLLRLKQQTVASRGTAIGELPKNQ